MKPSEFKKILKPLIKQTVREVILEEGLLSNIVSEVAKGMSGNVVMESRTANHDADLKRKEEEYERNRQERIKRLNESTKIAPGVFQNTAPIAESNGRGPLAGVSSADPGVDISAIQELSKGKWKHLI